MTEAQKLFGSLLPGLLAGILAMAPPVQSAPSSAGLEGVARCNPGEDTSNIAVYLTRPGLPLPPPPARPVILDQRNLRFIPHVLPILVGTRVQFPNSDQIRHNVFSASEARMFNLGIYPSGVSREVTFDRPGVVEVLCNVHPEMSAYILVLATPYYSATDRASRFRFSNLPPGEYELSFWCEHRGELRQPITLDSAQELRCRATLHSGLIQVEPSPAATPTPPAQPEEPGGTLFPERRIR